MAHAEQMTNLASKFLLKCKRFQLKEIEIEKCLSSAPTFCLAHIFFDMKAVQVQDPPHAYAAQLDEQVNWL